MNSSCRYYAKLFDTLFQSDTDLHTGSYNNLRFTGKEYKTQEVK